MTIETSYSIKLSNQEAETIQKALHAAYMEIKKSDEHEAEKRLRGMNELKELRNSFSAITRTQYMGIDA